MSDIGFYTLIMALVLGLYAGSASVVGARMASRPARERPAKRLRGRGAPHARDGPPFLRLRHPRLLDPLRRRSFQSRPGLELLDRGALGGQDGSLLLWVWILSLYTAVVAWQNRSRNRALAPYVIAVLCASILFFIFLLLFVANPFEKLRASTSPPTDAAEPLLQHPAMMIHPPCLYTGYVGLAVPSPSRWRRSSRTAGRRVDPSTRRWMLFPWFFLGSASCSAALGLRGAGLGRVLGLGSGGERLAHALARRDGLPALRDDPGEAQHDEFWNHFLVALTFLLSLFGTFITAAA